MSRREAFWREGRVSAKALRSDHNAAWHVAGAARRPAWLGQGKYTRERAKDEITSKDTTEKVKKQTQSGRKHL